jgi:leucyl-tRNA synthetase
LDAIIVQVWDHVFLDAPYPEGCGIPQEYLAKLKAEFNFWYPMDLRVSGKDLIANHLTMSLYNHAAIWNGAKNRMPRAFFTNGHVQVDGRKMSKSEGNFLTLKDSVELYSADACRLALAVSGDSLDDANFEKNTADSYILRFTLELDWMQGTVEAAAQGKLREGETSYWDVVLEHNIRTCIVNTEKHYRA